MMMEISWPV